MTCQSAPFKDAGSPACFVSLIEFSQVFLEFPKTGSIIDVQEGMGVYVQVLTRNHLHLQTTRFQDVENAQDVSSELIFEHPQTFPGIDAAKWLDPTLQVGRNDNIKSSFQAPQFAEQFGRKKGHIAAKETVVWMIRVLQGTADPHDRAPPGYPVENRRRLDQPGLTL